MKMQFTAVLLLFALCAIRPIPVQCQDTIPTTTDELPSKSLDSVQFASGTFAQHWQMNFGLGIIGRGALLDASVQLGFNQNLFMSLGYGGAVRTSKNKPNNYDGGWASLFTWGAENAEVSSTFHLTLGLQALVTNKMIWSFEAGPSLGYCTSIKYTRKDNPGLGSNYYTDEMEYRTVPGVTLKAVMRFVLSDAVGLDFGLVGNINTRYSYGALKMGLNIGQLK